MAAGCYVLGVPRGHRSRARIACATAFAVALLGTPWAERGARAQEAQEAPQAAAAERAAAERVVAVTGDDVFLRAGASVDFHDLGTTRRGDLLVVEGEDAEFLRVRVPGGLVLYVFAALVEWEEGALRGTVRGDDVLLRATPSQSFRPLDGQKLARGDELLVLGAVEGDGGRWLRVLAPARCHAWIAARYTREAGETRSLAGVLERAGLARQDELTGGRTRTEREERRAAEIREAHAQLEDLAARSRAEAAPDDTELRAALQRLARDAPLPEQRARARDLLQGLDAQLAKRRADAAERARRAEAEAAKERAQRAADEARRRREDEEERARRQADRRGTPAAEGDVLVRGGETLLVEGGSVRLVLTSRRFRLGDYAGRRVRVWGIRESRAGATDTLEVTSLEILAAGR